jgi:hypothetical protein
VCVCVCERRGRGADGVMTANEEWIRAAAAVRVAAGQGCPSDGDGSGGSAKLDQIDSFYVATRTPYIYIHHVCVAGECWRG